MALPLERISASAPLPSVPAEFKPASLWPWDIRSVYLPSTQSPEAPVEARPLCFLAILYILVWHLIGYAKPSPNPLLASGEVLSYCCHGLLFFLLFYSIGSGHRGGFRCGVADYFKKTFLPVYLLFLAALTGAWGLNLIDQSAFWKGAFLLDGLLAHGLLSFWFITIILLCYLLVPLYLSGYSHARAAGITSVLLLVLGVVKLQTHWVDIRLFQFLVLFAFAISASQGAGLLPRVVQSSFALAWIGLLLLLSVAAASRFEARPLIFSLFCGVAMVMSLVWFMKLAAWSQKVGSLKPLEALGGVWFCAFLLHRLAYSSALMILRPASGATTLVWLLGVGLPVTLAAAYSGQASYRRVLSKLWYPSTDC